MYLCTDSLYTDENWSRDANIYVTFVLDPLLWRYRGPTWPFISIIPYTAASLRPKCLERTWRAECWNWISVWRRVRVLLLVKGLALLIFLFLFLVTGFCGRRTRWRITRPRRSPSSTITLCSWCWSSSPPSSCWRTSTLQCKSFLYSPLRVSIIWIFFLFTWNIKAFRISPVLTAFS